MTGLAELVSRPARPARPRAGRSARLLAGGAARAGGRAPLPRPGRAPGPLPRPAPGVPSVPPNPLAAMLMLTPARYYDRRLAELIVPMIAGGRTARDRRVIGRRTRCAPLAASDPDRLPAPALRRLRLEQPPLARDACGIEPWWSMATRPAHAADQRPLPGQGDSPRDATDRARRGSPLPDRPTRQRHASDRSIPQRLTSCRGTPERRALTPELCRLTRR